MKKFLCLAVEAALVATLGCSCQRNLQTADYNVIPLPNNVEMVENQQPFRLDASTVIACPRDNADLQRDAQFLREYVAELTDRSLTIVNEAPAKNVIDLQANLQSDNPEAYTISVSSDRIVVNGATPAGTFYGIQTLRKAIPAAQKSDVDFPAAEITDAPRFGYRGAHLDVCRHFFPEDSVKKFIDMLALHNINRMHWHLTEDQGWRVEIKSHPALTEVGSKRKGTMVGKDFSSSDSVPYGGFYTQDQIRDIVKYAQERYITIIPEIDLPGHMMGALTAYPQLGCTGGPYDVWQRWGVSEDLLCAGNDSIYPFLDDVLGEITELFPSEYIHVGGDECPKTRWAECPKCQAKIKELGLVSDEHGSKEEKLQSYVLHHVSDFLASKGRKVIGWDEILEGGAAPGSVIMSWRGEAGGIEAAKKDHDVIMTPNTYLYFDYYQTLDQKDEPLAIGGYVPVKLVYNYEPMPEALTPEEAKHIIGIQANLWTEYVPTYWQVEYMELPRMAALAEVQWSQPDQKDYAGFTRRLPQLVEQYKAQGYHYATHVFDVDGTVSSNPQKGEVNVALSTPDGADIRYTTDGSEPTEASPLYSDTLRLKERTVVKARAFRKDGPSRLYADSLTFSKSTFKPVALENQPAPRYVGNGPQALTDGVYGPNAYTNPGWIGFNGTDLVAVVDLGQEQEVSEVDVRCYVVTNEWVFDARSMKVEVAQLDNKWQQVYSQAYPAATAAFQGIVNHQATFPAVKASKVKVTLTAEKSIPSWHDGAGKAAFLFADEIEVN